METIADRLKLIRIEKYGKRGMAEFAKKIKISPSGYLNYERGDRQLPSDVLSKIAKCTSVNLHWLITGEGSPYPKGEITKEFISKIKETEMSDKIEAIPRLVKHCLMRATIGSIAALIVPYMIKQIAEQNLQLALNYVKSIPDLNLGDKLTAYYAIVDKLMEKDRDREAIEVADKVVEAIYQHDDPLEKLKTLPSMVRWYVRCEDMSKAHQIIVKIDDMKGILKSASARPEFILKFYRQLAEAKSEIGYLHQAKNLLDKSLKLGQKKLKASENSEALNVHLSRCSVQYAYLSLKFIGQGRPREYDFQITLTVPLDYRRVDRRKNC